jgi:hypothetical protein
MGNRDIHIRVGGDFTATHLPWYHDDKVMNMSERFSLYTNQQRYSTTKHLVLNYMVANYHIINKNKQLIFVNKLLPNNILEEDFTLLDRYLDGTNYLEISDNINSIVYCAKKSQSAYFFPLIQTNPQILQHIEENSRNITLLTSLDTIDLNTIHLININHLIELPFLVQKILEKLNNKTIVIINGIMRV